MKNSKSVGLHFGERNLTAVEVRCEEGLIRLWRIGMAPLSVDLSAETLLNEATQSKSGTSLKALFESSDIDPQSVSISLGGDFAVIKRIPLELASEDERREQVMWEAGQHLLDSPGDFKIDYHPFGRTAFLVAIRTRVVEAIRRVCESADIGIKSLEVDPLTLFYACMMTSNGNLQAGRDAIGKREANPTSPSPAGADLLEGSHPVSTIAVHIGDRWATCISVSGADLAGVEMIRLDHVGWKLRQGDSEDRKDPVEGGTVEDSARTLGRRIAFGLVPERRSEQGSRSRRVLLSGDPRIVEEISRCWKEMDHFSVAFIDSFACVDTQSLPLDQRPTLDWNTGFAVSAGAAYRQLCA